MAAAPASAWAKIFAGSKQKQLGPFGKDSNWPLLKSALTTMKTQVPDPDFIIFPGDFLAHNLRQFYNTSVSQPSDDGFRAFVNKTMEFLVGQMQRTFPGVPILPTLGNNDDDCGDYELTPNGPYLEATLDLAKRMIRRRVDAGFDASWRAGGNYSVPHPTLRGVRFVSVNTVYLTPKYSNACGARTVDPGADTLTWLSDTLAAARAAKQTVWLLQHVPPGMDPYSTAHHGSCPNNLKPMYAPQYQDAYYRLIRDNADIITVAFSGHTHMDEFRLVGDGKAGVFSLVTPAISPIFGESPAFRAFTLAGSGTLQNQSTYYLKNLAAAGPGNPAQWVREYDFRRTWEAKRIDLPAMQNIYQRVAAGGPAEVLYFKLFSVSTSGSAEIAPANQRAYVCAVGAAQTSDYAACYCGAPSPQAQSQSPVQAEAQSQIQTEAQHRY